MIHYDRNHTYMKARAVYCFRDPKMVLYLVQATMLKDMLPLRRKISHAHHRP